MAARVPGRGGDGAAVAHDGDGDPAHPLARIIEGSPSASSKTAPSNCTGVSARAPKSCVTTQGPTLVTRGPVCQHADANLGIGAVQDRDPVPRRILHAAGAIAPVDEEAGMGIKRILGIGEDVLAHPQRRIARGQDPGAKRGLAGQRCACVSWSIISWLCPSAASARSPFQASGATGS